MKNYLIQQLARAWERHWGLQMASVTVMTLVLVMLNFLFLGYSAFHHTIDQWGRGLEMIVYLKENAAGETLERFRTMVEQSGDFEDIRFTAKEEATQKFLTALGPESLELLKDPKWSSPIPASFELRLKSSVPVANRVSTLETWGARFKAYEYVEDVFYGQGWVENFTKFLVSARGLVLVMWILSVFVGLLIVGNCIRLSFSQRREEIEILELVGATKTFIRLPFLLEGAVIGLFSSVASIALSWGLHKWLLNWSAKSWAFWMAFDQLSPMTFWMVIINLITALIFGVLGAWYCVRKINTGWSAAVS